jgi:hypothetical protein
MVRGDSGTRDADPREGFEWVCPFCGESRLNVADDERNAELALRTHITASAGDGHGPANDLPSGVDTSSLTEQVVRVDGDGGSTGRE